MKKIVWKVFDDNFVLGTTFCDAIFWKKNYFGSTKVVMEIHFDKDKIGYKKTVSEGKKKFIHLYLWWFFFMKKNIGMKKLYNNEFKIKKRYKNYWEKKNNENCIEKVLMDSLCDDKIGDKIKNLNCDKTLLALQI